MPPAPDPLQLDPGRWELLTRRICPSILEHARAHTLRSHIRRTRGQFGDLLVIGRRTQHSRPANDDSSGLHKMPPCETGNQDFAWLVEKNVGFPAVPAGLDPTPHSAPGLPGDLKCHFPNL